MSKLHHSVADWDFLNITENTPAATWYLDTGVYVSPPSSLGLWGFGSASGVYVLSKLALAGNLKAGRLTTYARRNDSAIYKGHFFIGVNPSIPTYIIHTFGVSEPQFTRRRIDWWQGFDLQNNPATIVLPYRWEDPNWVPLNEEYHPPLTSNINRVGIGVPTYIQSRRINYDDTEIWIPS